MSMKHKFVKKAQKLHEKITRYIYLYDPGYLSFIYSIKALFASALSVGINAFLFGLEIVIWAALMPIYLYFLNVILVEQKQSIWYFLIFIFLSAFLCMIFTLIFPYGLWLIVPLALMGFFAGIVGSYDLDLQRVLNMSLLNSLIACIYASSFFEIALYKEVLTILIGGFIGLFIHFFLSFKKYGKLIRKYFPDLLFDLELMIKSLHQKKDFIAIRNQTLIQIEALKKILNSRAGNIKDAHMMKDTKRILFYLYRIEEIYQCINAIHDDMMHSQEIFSPIRAELIFNLREISGMFEGHMPHLKYDAFRSFSKQDNKDIPLFNTLRIIYNKIDNFRRGGLEEDYFVETKKQKSIGVIWKSMHWENVFFRYGVKYAFVLGFSLFIADVFGLEHGAWIAMACIAIIRPNLGGVKDIGREYFIGISIGLALGVLLVFLTYGSLVFYIIFVLILFFFIYFRVYPYGLWASFMMMTFIMMFCSVYGESYALIMDRFLDIALAFGIVFFAFLLLWPKYGGSDIVPNIKKSLDSLYDLCDFMMKNLDDLKMHRPTFMQQQKEFFVCHDALALCLKEAKKEKNIIGDLKEARKSLRYLDFLNQNTLKIYYTLMDMPKDAIHAQKGFYLNDLNLIKTRYEMLNRALQESSFYFKEQKDERFLSQNEAFSAMIDLLFEAQNGLFLSLQPNIRR